MRIVVMDAFKMKKICNVLEISLGRHRVTTFTETAKRFSWILYSENLLLFKQNTIHNN